MKKFNVSNSLLNRFIDYRNADLCGLRFEAVNLLKTHSEFTSRAMQNGNWFEYMCTGAINRDGSTPEGETIKSGKLSAEAYRIEKQVKNFDKIYKKRIYDSDIIMEQVLDGQNYKAVFDILEYNEEGDPIAIRDLKLTGVIDNKWEDYGWVDIRSKKHIRQAKFYIWIYWRRTGIILPFYFDVFSSKNPIEFKMFRVTMDEAALIEFEVSLKESVKMLFFDIETGFIVYPDLMPCHSCPLKNECKSFTDMPKIEYINL